jgi:hypothetical protein
MASSTCRLPSSQASPWVPENRKSLAWLLLGLCSLGYCIWEGVLPWTNHDAEAGVAAVGLLALVSALVFKGRWHELADTSHFGSPPSTARWRAGALAWVSLLLISAAWDFYSFLEQRRDLPTLSRILGHVSGNDPGRAFMVAVWLLSGAYLLWGPAGRQAPRRPSE